VIVPQSRTPFPYYPAQGESAEASDE
jgi:hypothetical protein